MAAGGNVRAVMLFAGLVALAPMVTDVAGAEELVMPYACAADANAPNGVRLTPSPPQSYAVTGRRDEQPFVHCPAGAGGDCVTVMVHRFQILCGGEKVAWSRVAVAAQAAGAVIPEGLPQGFAPAGPLKARFVFPAQARFAKHEASVSSEALSADGIREAHDRGGAAAVHDASWQTVIRAEMRTEPAGSALRIAGLISVLMAALLIVSMMMAGRHPLPANVHEAALRRLRRLPEDVAALWGRITAMAARTFKSGPQSDEKFVNALAIAKARLAETELLVATLPRELLLREVLQSELETVRTRLTALEAAPAREGAKAGGRVRALLRDLERVQRIAHGAAGDGAAQQGASEARSAPRMPGSAQEAYQILGINPDAAPQVAKKLVDALRMSWHPDFARDDDDRRVREARMKQINAAWDIIKDRRQAA